METCIYFVEKPDYFTGPPPSAGPAGAALLLRGFGFTAAGQWRGPAWREGAAGLLLDDRFLPDRQGLRAARQALEGWRGLVIFDFERAPSPLPAELVRSLKAARVVLPPAWAELPHEAVLVGPWPGTHPFPRWLEERRARYGSVLLDAMPLRAAAAPGGRREPWRGALPEEGFDCPALGCLHRRLPDGRLLFWDTRKTLAARLGSAGVPAVLFREDWDNLQSSGNRQSLNRQ